MATPIKTVERPSAEAENARFTEWAERMIDENLPRIHAELEEMQRCGIINGKGKVLVEDPPDMRPDSKTDLTTL